MDNRTERKAINNIKKYLHDKYGYGFDRIVQAHIKTNDLMGVEETLDNGARIRHRQYTEFHAFEILDYPTNKTNQSQ